jgi:hypothetical protein
LFTRLGANDPDFNLRRDPAFLIRRRGEGDVVFVNVIEPHGSYDPVSETALNSDSNIADLALVYDDADYTAIVIEDREGRSSLFVLSNSDLSASSRHELIVGGRSFNWSGPYHFADF